MASHTVYDLDVGRTRSSKNRAQKVRNAQPEVPFSDLLLKDLTRGANAVSASSVLGWVRSVAPQLRLFKTSIIDNQQLYSDLKDMLGGADYLRWKDDHKEQHRVGAVCLQLMAPTSTQYLRGQISIIISQMLAQPIPGADASNSCAARAWKHKMCHDLLLTCLMELQTPRSGYFSKLCGGRAGRVLKWSTKLRVKGLGPSNDISRAEPLATTPGEQPKKRRKTHSKKSGAVQFREKHLSRRSQPKGVARPSRKAPVSHSVFLDHELVAAASPGAESEDQSDSEYEPEEGSQDDSDSSEHDVDTLSVKGETRKRKRSSVQSLSVADPGQSTEKGPNATNDHFDEQATPAGDISGLQVISSSGGAREGGEGPPQYTEDGSGTTSHCSQEEQFVEQRLEKSSNRGRSKDILKEGDPNDASISQSTTKTTSATDRPAAFEKQEEAMTTAYEGPPEYTSSVGDRAAHSTAV